MFEKSRYGIEELSKWNFETWNEPDHHRSSGMNKTLSGYLDYVQHVQWGLKNVSSHLRLGGPGMGHCEEFHDVLFVKFYVSYQVDLADRPTSANIAMHFLRR